MKRWNRLLVLLVISLLFGSCATFDEGMGSMKKSFPARTDNTVK